ncbi:amidohydrolase family protein [Roseomonas sp. OT10]|uniref:amidohydrolase family protein n=1 Tax=Roseomonas cutis TaxID=2897332 RepID=UPI001E4C7ACA|nr:amidohydrolase family protein [Roseomonas sp. OT10]UFN47142.1 amidohydrolase family protein [Roseomonas sp. OT10]
MRAIDVHVHPMNADYVAASAPFVPAAQRMFGDRFDARPDEVIAEDFRRDDTLAIPIAWDAMAGAGGAVYGNDQLAALCAAWPDVFLPGWAVVDPWRGRSGLEEIEHAIRDLKLMGVKYQPPVQGFAPSGRHFYPIWDLLQDLGAPALIHCGTTAIGSGEPGGLGFKLEHGRPLHIDAIAADFPRLNIVAAHPGWPWTEELIAVALHKGNVSIDVSGWGPKYIPAPLKHDMQRRLQDKVMFGSDYPGWSPGQTLDEWEMQGFKPPIVEKLFRANARRILNLDAAIAKAEAARQAG